MDARERRALEGAVTSARIAIGYALSTLDWRDDQKTMDAIAKRIEEVAEKLRRVKPERRARISLEIPWSEAIGIREVIAHEYDILDRDIVEDVIDNRLPDLIRQIEIALSAEGG